MFNVKENCISIVQLDILNNLYIYIYIHTQIIETVTETGIINYFTGIKMCLNSYETCMNPNSTFQRS